MPYKDPEKRRAYHRAYNARWYQDNRDSARKRHALNYLENQEENRARHRAYDATHREEKAIRAARHYQENPELYAEKRHRWYARKKNSPLRDRIYRRVVFARDNGVCRICQRPVDPKKWDLDHVVPLSRNGTHTYDNVAVAHPSCNRAKGARA